MPNDARSVSKSVLFTHRMLMSAVHMSTPGVLFTLADQLGRAVLPLFVCCEGAALLICSARARVRVRGLLYEHVVRSFGGRLLTTTPRRLWCFRAGHALEWDLSAVLPGCVECVRVWGTRRTISHRSRMRRLRPAVGLAQMFHADSMVR